MCLYKFKEKKVKSNYDKNPKCEGICYYKILRVGNFITYHNKTIQKWHFLFAKSLNEAKLSDI